MPKTPTKNCDAEPVEPEEEKSGNWSEDQKRRQYYYDDAHGYEVYDPEAEGDNEDAEDEPVL